MTDERDAMREAFMSGQSVRDALTEYAAPLPEAPESVAWCGASMRANFARAVPYMGPCVLRAGHDGPVHQDVGGRTWTDPRPATVEDAEVLCPPPRRKLLRDLTREAVDAGTYGEPAPEMAPALRDRIADVLRATFDEWIVAEWICCEPPKPGFAHKLCRKGHAARHMVASLLADDHEQHPPTSPILDAVLPVVEAALAEQATRKESFQVRAERSAHDAECERVWNEYPKVIDALREQTQRAERVEALLRDLVDPDDCYFDHHGGCQAHGYLSLQPGEKCPHTEAKELLAALDQPEAPDHA